jgi:hypothetical protein
MDRRHAHVLSVIGTIVDHAESRESRQTSSSGLRNGERMLRYRLPTTTVAVHREAAQPVAISIPSGTVLTVPDDSANSSGFVEVEWDGKSVQVFAVDLRDRGELIKARSA